MRTFRVLAAIMFAFAAALAFGWPFDQDTQRAIGLIAAGCLTFTLSTIPVGPVA